MTSIDLKKDYRESYTARVGKPALVKIPPRPCLMIDGAGDPNSAEYAEAISSLYPIAYALRALVKLETGDAYTVMPLEGLWWADDMEAYLRGQRDDWKWTAMIVVPEVVTLAMAASVIAETTETKRLAAGGRVRFEVFDEGLSAQVMHVGPYSAEAPAIELLHGFIAGRGMARRGLHHEIYLSNPDRTDPQKLKTIIRQPVS
jgi:hypothetical protein